MVDYRKPTIGGLPALDFVWQQSSMQDSTQYIEIGRRLRAVREAFGGLSQKSWAEKHAFGQTQWNNWEAGARRIPVDCAERLCEAYGLTLDFVYRGRRDGLADTASKVL
jgi:hypothetical protein